MKKRRKNRRKAGCLFFIILMVIAIIFSVSKCGKRNDTAPTKKQSHYNSSDINAMITDFAKKHNLQTDEYPERLVEMLKKNPETKDFVLNYPLNKGKNYKIDLSDAKNGKNVPLFLQWDERWGYYQYAGDLMGLTGCGPTCLSMVSVYLLKDDKYTPKYIARFAETNGYSVIGNGSSWNLISEGGKRLGLDVTEIPLNESRIIRNLEAGNPIICIMGAGDFTSTGHFIVMTDYVDGKIKVNDPNSQIRSKKLWELDDIKYQIKNLWVCRK